MSSKIPLHIDVDTGTDDAIAILCALMSQEQVDILSFSAVAGNVAVEHTSQNTLNIVSMMGEDIPVAIGASKPLLRDLNIAISHGANGLGDVKIENSKKSFSDLSAYEQIYASAKKAKGELIYLGIGPQTNLAIALTIYPELKWLIKRIHFMGGALIGGNMTPASEYNAYVDPEAMKIIVNSGIPITMVGLDVTLQTELPIWVLEELRLLENKYARLATEIMDFMLARNKQWGYDVANIHDALAFCSIVKPDVITTTDYLLDVSLGDDLVRGMTVADFNNVITNKSPNASCATAVNVKEFWNWMVDLFKSYDLKGEKNNE